eukprot:7388900-Pyramimonas_sp.AAC.1
MCADDIDHPIRTRDSHTAEIGPLHWCQVLQTFKRAQIEHHACCKVLRGNKSFQITDAYLISSGMVASYTGSNNLPPLRGQPRGESARPLRAR